MKPSYSLENNAGFHPLSPLKEKIKMYLFRKQNYETGISIGNFMWGQVGELESPEAGKKQQFEG